MQARAPLAPARDPWGMANPTHADGDPPAGDPPAPTPPAGTPPVEPTTPPAGTEDPDPIEQARIEASRKANAEAKAQRDRAKAAEAELEKLRAEAEERRLAELSAAEAAEERAAKAEAALADATAKARAATIATELERAARAAGYSDPTDALQLAGQIQTDDDGKPVGVAEAVKALAEAKPHYLAGPGTPGLDPSNHGKQDPPEESPEQKLRRHLGHDSPSAAGIFRRRFLSDPSKPKQ
jgi:hypothetical protein